jgi:hypothetical protein
MAVVLLFFTWLPANVIAATTLALIAAVAPLPAQAGRYEALPISAARLFGYRGTLLTSSEPE